MTKLLLLAVVGLATTLAAGCMSSDDPSVKATSSAAAGTYTMTLKVSHFDLVDFASHTSVKDGQGHIHYFVNGADACTAGKATCAAPTDYATTSTSFTFKSLVAGDRVSAELVNNDHSSLSPKVSVTQTV